MQMLADCFRRQSPGQAPLGKSADGRFVYMSFRPTVFQQAHLMTPFLDERATAGDVLPIPRGFTLSKCAFNGQLQISLIDRLVE